MELQIQHFLYVEAFGCTRNNTCHLTTGFSWKLLDGYSMWKLHEQSYIRINSGSKETPNILVFLIGKSKVSVIKTCQKIGQATNTFVTFVKSADRKLKIKVFKGVTVPSENNFKKGYFANMSDEQKFMKTYNHKKSDELTFKEFLKNGSTLKGYTFNTSNKFDENYVIGSLGYTFQTNKLKLYFGKSVTLTNPVFWVHINKILLDNFRNLQVCLLGEEEEEALETPLFTNILPGQHLNISFDTTTAVKKFFEILNPNQHTKFKGIIVTNINCNYCWNIWYNSLLVIQKLHVHQTCMNNTCMILSDEDIHLGIVGKAKSNISLQINTYYTGRSVCGGLSHVQVNLPYSMETCKFTFHHETSYLIIKPVKSMYLNIWFTELQVSDEWLEYCQCSMTRPVVKILGYDEQFFFITYLFGIPVKVTSISITIQFDHMCEDCLASLKWFAKSIWPSSKLIYLFTIL